MAEITSKSGLAIALSRLEGFSEPKVRQEQYATDSEIAAFVLWQAALLGDIGENIISDLGCGTGILGIGALMLGAKQVLFVDSDKKALGIAKSNISKVKSEGFKLGRALFVCKDVAKLSKTELGRVDTVLQNPPFGTKNKHADILFLKKALQTAPVVYSFHKSETKTFLGQFSAKNNSKITHVWNFRLPLKATFAFHRRQSHRINVSCLRLEASTKIIDDKIKN